MNALRKLLSTHKARDSYPCPVLENLQEHHLTNRFDVAMCLFSNWSQKTTKCGKNKKMAHKQLGECVSDVLTTFWHLLWSTTEQTHGNMESICFLYNNPSNSSTLIGSRLWSIRGQRHRWWQRSISISLLSIATNQFASFCIDIRSHQCYFRVCQSGEIWNKRAFFPCILIFFII